MIKLLIKLTIVGLIANGTWRVGSAYVSHYKFHDSIEETTQYRDEKTDEEVRERIFQLASQFEIPVDHETLTVRTQNSHTIVEVSYKRPVDLLPGYTYLWPFSLHIDTSTIEPQKLDPSGVQ